MPKESFKLLLSVENELSKVKKVYFFAQVIILQRDSLIRGNAVAPYVYRSAGFGTIYKNTCYMKTRLYKPQYAQKSGFFALKPLPKSPKCSDSLENHRFGRTSLDLDSQKKLEKK